MATKKDIPSDPTIPSTFGFSTEDLLAYGEIADGFFLEDLSVQAESTPAAPEPVAPEPSAPDVTVETSGSAATATTLESPAVTVTSPAPVRQEDDEQLFAVEPVSDDAVAGEVHAGVNLEATPARALVDAFIYEVTSRGGYVCDPSGPARLYRRFAVVARAINDTMSSDARQRARTRAMRALRSRPAASGLLLRDDMGARFSPAYELLLGRDPHLGTTSYVVSGGLRAAAAQVQRDDTDEHLHDVMAAIGSEGAATDVAADFRARGVVALAGGATVAQVESALYAARPGASLSLAAGLLDPADHAFTTPVDAADAHFAATDLDGGLVDLAAVTGGRLAAFQLRTEHPLTVDTVWCLDESGALGCSLRFATGDEEVAADRVVIRALDASGSVITGRPDDEELALWTATDDSCALTRLGLPQPVDAVRVQTSAGAEASVAPEAIRTLVAEQLRRRQRPSPADSAPLVRVWRKDGAVIGGVALGCRAGEAGPAELAGIVRRRVAAWEHSEAAGWIAVAADGERRPHAGEPAGVTTEGASPVAWRATAEEIQPVVDAVIHAAQAVRARDLVTQETLHAALTAAKAAVAADEAASPVATITHDDRGVVLRALMEWSGGWAPDVSPAIDAACSGLEALHGDLSDLSDATAREQRCDALHGDDVAGDAIDRLLLEASALLGASEAQSDAAALAALADRFARSGADVRSRFRLAAKTSGGVDRLREALASADAEGLASSAARYAEDAAASLSSWVERLRSEMTDAIAEGGALRRLDRNVFLLKLVRTGEEWVISDDTCQVPAVRATPADGGVPHKAALLDAARRMIDRVRASAAVDAVRVSHVPRRRPPWPWLDVLDADGVEQRLLGSDVERVEVLSAAQVATDVAVALGSPPKLGGRVTADLDNGWRVTAGPIEHGDERAPQAALRWVRALESSQLFGWRGPARDPSRTMLFELAEPRQLASFVGWIEVDEDGSIVNSDLAPVGPSGGQLAFGLAEDDDWLADVAAGLFARSLPIAKRSACESMGLLPPEWRERFVRRGLKVVSR